MMKYLIILLDDSANSFCHYQSSEEKNPMPLDILKRGITYAMKRNMRIQYIFPHCQIPGDTSDTIDDMYNTKIMPNDNPDRGYANVIVFDNVQDFIADKLEDDAEFVLRLNKKELFDNYQKLTDHFIDNKHLSFVITDIENFSEEDFAQYGKILEVFEKDIYTKILNGEDIQFNLVCERMMLDSHNNCNAGTENITLAPNGHFYICPAFYYEDKENYVGSIFDSTVDIKNQQLLDIEHAPLCRRCDAYQCHRCIWLNKKTTLEVNTPSHEQCVISHLERNISRKLLMDINNSGKFLINREIKEITYLDPFDVREKL